MIFLKIIKWAVVAIAIGLCVLVALANTLVVPFSLEPLPLDIEIPVFGIVFISFFFGLLVGALFLAINKLRSRRQIRLLNKRITELEDQLYDSHEDAHQTVPQTRRLFG